MQSGRLSRKLLSTLLILLMIGVVLTPLSASAADSDGDTVDDSLDDCPHAAGTSTIDKTGCPDRDGDGYSDTYDGWTSNNPNFGIDQQLTGGSHYSVDHNSDGSLLATAAGTQIRIFDTSTHTNVRSSAQLVGGNNAYITSIDWSPDDAYIAATLSDDTATILHASNLTIVHEDITHTGSSRTFSDVAFFPNSTSIAVVDEASGGWGGGTCTGCAVMLIDVATGSIWREVKPAGNSGSYSSVAFSEDGSRMAVGGDGNAYLINTSAWTTVRAMNPGSGANVHSIDISPDGNTIAMCTGYDNGVSQLRAFRTSDGASILSKTGTSSCYGVDVSPDSNQVAYAIGYYGSDGGRSVIYEIQSGTLIDTMTVARGNNACTQNGGQNPCGNVNSASWHPDGFHIALAVSRNYNGLYFMFADLDPDNDGYNSTDQGDGIVDAFPDDGTQWDDTDNDGYGDNPAPAFQPDACITTWGNSTEDRFGCPDADGDGWSDDNDWAPSNKEQWVDADNDGYGDNYLYEIASNQLHINQRGDAFPNDATQWNDTDGDGYGDNYEDVSWNEYRAPEWPGEIIVGAQNIDVFPLDRTQWRDTDGDWVGDEQMSDRADGCPTVWGNSTYDRLGCIDTDGDGYSDPDAGWPTRTDCYGADAFPNDPTQWCDEDNDGYGSNPDGNNPDDCPNQAGPSTEDQYGCPDRDGDGYSNTGDPFPDDGTQWEDSDGDNYGDNPDGNNPDFFPNDASQWRDSDGDGYGDNPGGTNGDRFPTDPTQWSDADNDGYGDNFVDTDGDGVSEGNSDVCPQTYGESNSAASRGCPDSDGDGFTDPEDAFPNQPLQWADQDGDGFGDNVQFTDGDECIDVYGKSTENGVQGCPDSDGDGHADPFGDFVAKPDCTGADAFPNDPLQWCDKDGDGVGDNYVFTNITVPDEENTGLMIELCEQIGDAFPNDATQWADMDCDGRGDNSTGIAPDAFPLRKTQQDDNDGDGYGNNFTNGAYQPDECRNEYGTSTIDRFGCPDSDNDGMSDLNDPCKWDPAVSVGIPGQVTCSITEDPNKADEEETVAEVEAKSSNVMLYAMGGIIAFMLAAILVAMLARQASRNKMMRERAIERKAEEQLMDEEERRQQWIDYYVANGEFDKARELGWVDPASLPAWKQHEIQQQEALQASIPTMLDLD